MSDKPQQEHNQSLPQAAKPREGFFNSMWADVAGAALTVTSGVIASYRKINSIFYQNIKVVPEIGGARPFNGEQPRPSKKQAAAPKGLFPEAQERATAIAEEVKAHPGAAPVKRKMHNKLLDAHAREYDGKLTELLEKNYGIDSKNIWHKLEKLRPHQKVEVAYNALATMAVTLGAVVTLAAARSVLGKQEHIESRLDRIEAGHQR